MIYTAFVNLAHGNASIVLLYGRFWATYYLYEASEMKSAREL